MNVVAPPSKISSGVDVEELSFTWELGNFPVLRKHKHMINSQRFPFTAGRTTGRPSQWTAYLTETKKDEKRWIGIFLHLRSPEPTDTSLEASYLLFRCSINNKEGKIIRGREFGQVHVPTTYAEFPARGFHEFIDADDVNLATEESLEIHITFKLYTPSQYQFKLASSPEGIMEKFQVRFLDQLRKDFAGLLEIPDPCAGIKIISCDEKEFSMQKGILAARSEVFAAMLRSGMIEATSGVIKLTDISSKALEVFLNFLKTGVLLPEWSEAGVIVELTNAAAEYQRQDLLQFLDATMGKLCQLQNVLALLTLARQLSLKVAEEDLMMFVRKKGVSSADNVLRMCNAELPGIQSTPTPAGAADRGKKRKKDQR